MMFHLIVTHASTSQSIWDVSNLLRKKLLASRISQGAHTSINAHFISISWKFSCLQNQFIESVISYSHLGDRGIVSLILKSVSLNLYAQTLVVFQINVSGFSIIWRAFQWLSFLKTPYWLGSSISLVKHPYQLSSISDFKSVHSKILSQLSRRKSQLKCIPFKIMF